MAKLTLSDDLIKGIKILSSIEESKSNRVIQFIKDLPIGTSMRTAEQAFKSAIDLDDAVIVFRTIVGIINFVQKNNDKDAFNDFLESIGAIEDIDFDKVKSILTEILDNSNNLTLTTKAGKLLTTNNDNYIECKALTDIRLIFNESIAESTRSAVIVHKLHFIVSNPTNSNEIFIHLDLQDLKRLKDVIERAILKEEIIKEDYENINFVSLS